MNESSKPRGESVKDCIEIDPDTFTSTRGYFIAKDRWDNINEALEEYRPLAQAKFISLLKRRSDQMMQEESVFKLHQKRLLHILQCRRKELVRLRRKKAPWNF